MIFGLLIMGVIISIYGGMLIKKEAFEDIGPDRDNTKSQLDIIEDKLNILLMGGNYNQISEEIGEDQDESSEWSMDNELTTEQQDSGGPNYIEMANIIKKMSEENKSVEEMALALNIGKGEVLLLKRLLVR